nr:13997_t:CDS:2 [Entrophospora candida]
MKKKRRPDTTSLSTVKHFASCVTKKVERPLVLAINNGIHVHNANNIEGNKIKGYLNTKYKGIFDISYSKISSMITNLSELSVYLQQNAIPIVADNYFFEN